MIDAFQCRLYPDYPILLAMNDQLVAGFRGIRRQDRCALTLVDGLTYDRALLRWASNWRLAVPWLRYLLCWHRPARGLQIWQRGPGEQAGLLQVLQACRVQRFQAGALQQDGSRPVVLLQLNHK